MHTLARSLWMHAYIATYACFLDVSKDVASYVAIAIAIIILLLISIATYVAIYSKEKTVLENETHATHTVCTFVLRQYACALFILSRAHEICFLHIPRAYCLSDAYAAIRE